MLCPQDQNVIKSKWLAGERISHRIELSGTIRLVLQAHIATTLRIILPSILIEVVVDNPQEFGLTAPIRRVRVEGE